MSCCCCGTPSGEEIRKKERLVRREEEEEEEEEEETRRNMDISLLREQYRCTRETQRRHTQVLLRTVSEEPSDDVSAFPVTQGLTSPPAVTFDPDPAPCGDAWRVHLDLHRRCCPGVPVQLAAPSPETGNSNNSSFRRSSSSSESCSSFSSTTEDVNADGSRSDTGTGFSDRSRWDRGIGSSDGSRSRWDPGSESFDRSRGDPEKKDPVQVSVSGSLETLEQSLSDGSREDHPRGSDDGPPPVASITGSPTSSTTSLHEDLKEDQSSTAVPQTGLPSAWMGSRKFSAPALRFTRQLSVGGVGSSTGVHQNQNHHPFPNRKTPRISEAARRLGMYSSI